MAGENLIDKLSRKQAEDLLDKATKDIKVTVNVHENYELLEKASDEIKNTILNCKNPEIQLQKMSTNVVCLLPDFLKEPKDIKHKENKKEIDLYIESFENICVQINDYITNVHKSLNNIKNPYIDLDNEMTKILTTFTDTTKNLCGPILYKSEGLDRINTNNLSEEYKPVFACDNSSDKWGEKVLDIEIKAPSELKAMDPEKTCAIICNRHYDEVTLQLRSLGINHIEWYNDEFFSERALS